MGLLDKLWDDTVAGPQPESGLGRLRKHGAAPLSRPAAIAVGSVASSCAAAASDAAVKDEVAGGEDQIRVTRSIMIKRPAGCPSGPLSPGADSTPPASPAGSTPPLSPFAGRFRRKSLSDAYARSPKTPTSTPPFEA